jgi:branched-chain amino acid transport system substrate-binding protein
MVRRSTGFRWRIAVVAVALTGALVVAGCGSSSKGKGSSGGSLSAGQTYTVGYAASETGRLAIFEQPFIKGLKMQVAKINQAGGIGGKAKIKLVLEDAKSDPSTGGIVAQDLISKGAQFLITACDADASLPASQLAQKNGIPVLNSCGSGSSLPQQVGDDQFMNVYGTAVEGQGMAEFAKSLGYTNACIMTSHDIEYTDSMMSAAAQEFKRIGGKVSCTQTFTLDQPRYTTQATAIANAKPQVVLTSIFLPASVTFLKNLRAAGYTGPVIGDDGQEGSETFGAGSAAKDLYVFTFGFPSNDAAGQATAKWEADYKQTYGQAPGTVIAALGGDAGCLINAAVSKADSTDPSKVQAAMAGLVNAPCPTGPITYLNQKGIPKKYVVVLKTNPTANRFEFVKRFFPQTVTG